MTTSFHRPAFSSCEFLKNLILGVVIACASWSAWAHGGEDHGSDAPPAVGTPIAPRAYAQTQDFEMVAQLNGTTLTFTLDRFATNTPVVDAEIEVESGAALKALAQQIAPGIYTVKADAMAVPGKYVLSFSVQAGDTSDLLATTLDTTPHVEKLVHVHGRGEWTSWALSALLLCAGIGLVVVRRRKWTRKHPH